MAMVLALGLATAAAAAPAKKPNLLYAACNLPPAARRCQGSLCSLYLVPPACQCWRWVRFPLPVPPLLMGP